MVWSVPSALLFSFFFFLSVSLGAGASTLLAPSLPVIPFWRELTTPQCPTLYLLHPNSRSGNLFGDLQSHGFAESRVKISRGFQS
jgi:hypothetical protein